MTVNVLKPYQTDEEVLELYTSAGYALRVSGTVDREGLAEFSIYDEHHGTEAAAHLGPEERRALINWLETLP